MARSLKKAAESIRAELKERLAVLRVEHKLLEAQRREQRRGTTSSSSRDGLLPGIEKYSRHLDGRAPGEPPYTLLVLPRDYLLVVDEST